MHPWISAADGRVLVLLGAGASRPNLPTSTELVQGVFHQLNAIFSGDRSVDKLWRAIRPTAEKVGQVGNIEDVYEAVSTLAYQETDPTRHWIEGSPKKTSPPEIFNVARSSVYRTLQRSGVLASIRAVAVRPARKDSQCGSVVRTGVCQVRIVKRDSPEVAARSLFRSNEVRRMR